MADTSIEWAQKTWNALAGCSLESPGCTNCYAMRMAYRLALMGQQKYQGLTKLVNGKPVWTGQVTFDPLSIHLPLRWKKPQRIFVNSMSDLFHENLSDEEIDQHFAVMACAPQHEFLPLTKRSSRMRKYLCGARRQADIGYQIGLLAHKGVITWKDAERASDAVDDQWPLKNVWLGVSVEDQKRADARIPDLLAAPAAIRWISAEPLLGPLDLTRHLWGRAEPCDDCPRDADCACGLQSRRLNGESALDWVVIGGESGPGARDYRMVWGIELQRQLKHAGVKVFQKQVGSRPFLENMDSCGAPIRAHLEDRKGGDPAEWPLEMRVREYPR